MRKILPVLMAVMLAFASSPVAAQILQSVTQPAPSPAPPFKNQEEYAVSSIVRDIVEIMLYASARTHNRKFVPAQTTVVVRQVDGPAEKYSIALSSPELAKFDQTIQFKKCIYEIPTYAEVARNLATVLHLQHDDSGAISEPIVLKRLSDASMDALYEQNEFVSNALSQHPLNPQLHDEAALIRAAFNMMDYASIFRDWSFGDGRMAAHLAISSALRQGNHSSTSWKLANIALCAMSARSSEALTLLNETQDQASDLLEKSWIRTLNMLATADPRNFDTKDFTPLERFQYIYSLAVTHSPDKAIEFVTTKDIAPSVQLSRILNQSGCMGVPAGHVFSSNVLDSELGDFAQDLQRWQRKEVQLEPQPFGRELSLKPMGCIFDSNGTASAQTLSWNDVAQWHQRQILGGVYQSYQFYQWKYGDKKLAASLGERAVRLLWRAQLYPFLHVLIGAVSPEDRAPKWAITEVSRTPWMVPAQVWTYFLDSNDWEPIKEASRRWFGERPLFGTACDASFYASTLKPPSLDVTMLGKLRDINPFDRSLCMVYAEKKYGEAPNGDQLVEAFGKLADFDFGSKLKIAAGYNNSPEKYIARMSALAEEHPALYFELAGYCWAARLPDNTWKYYELGMKSADAVSKSHAAWPWIRHLFAAGNHDEAKDVADFAAAVYSSGGLEAKARYCEQLIHDYNCAEQQFKAINERYEYRRPLEFFYIRNRTQKPEYAKAAHELEKKYFPYGLLQDVPTERKSPPVIGTRVKASGEFGPAASLKPGDIVTAINGYRIFSREEASAIKEMTVSDRMRIVWWDGKQYHEAESPTFEDKIGVTLEDYVGKK